MANSVVSSFNGLQQKITQRIQKITAQRKSLNSKEVAKPFRRLDSLARLLEGNDICTAVYYDSICKKIIIANNKIHANSNQTNQSIKNIQAIFVLLTQQNLSVKQIIQRLTDAIIINLAQENRYGAIHEKEELKKLIKSYLRDSFNSGKPIKEWRDDNLAHANKTFVKIIKKTAQYLRDFLKLRASITASAHHNALSRDIFDALAKNRFEILHLENKDVHAEMRILNKLLQNQSNRGHYIGLSKLCCAHCAVAMAAFNVQTRGLHGQAFNWPLPAFLNKTQYLEKYLSTEIHSTYQQLSHEEKDHTLRFLSCKTSCNRNENAKHGRNMAADSSSSDVAFGVDISDSEEIALLYKHSLSEIRQIDRLLADYKSQFDALKELNVHLDIDTLLDWYKTDPTKLNDLLNDNVIALIELIKNAGEDEADDAFEELMDIYNTDSILFNTIMADEINEEHPLVRYGFNEFLKSYNKHTTNHCSYDSWDDPESSSDPYLAAKYSLASDEGWSYTNNSEDSQNRWEYNNYSSEKVYESAHSFFSSTEEPSQSSPDSSVDSTNIVLKRLAII